MYDFGLTDIRHSSSYSELESCEPRPEPPLLPGVFRLRVAPPVFGCYNCGNLMKGSPMGTVSVRMNDDLVGAARAAAKAEFRTVQGQIEFWAKVGRAALDNPDLPASFVAESLMSMAEPRDDTTPFVPRSRAQA